MKIIEKIEISYFRSFSEKKVVDQCKDLNIFSGKNDSGKSNILRALNIFFTENKIDFYKSFNFEEDFSKYRRQIVSKESVKGKKFIRIRILFNKIGIKSSVLPDQFWIEKTWDKDGKVSRKTKLKGGASLFDKPNSKKTHKVETSTTKFLKKINFLYIPAVKETSFFDFLKKEYQESLGAKLSRISKSPETDTKTLDEWISLLTVGDITEKLTDKINEESASLMQNFTRYAHEIKESSFDIPGFKIDFSKVLQVATENKIYLPFRGDGVQAKFIPQALDEITKNKGSKLIIWGFEEPENSLEYRNAQQLADCFKNEHAQKKQLFVTTHAFNFISLTGDTVSRYRIYSDGFEKGTQIILVDKDAQKNLGFEKSQEESLQEELGVLDLNQELSKIYKEKEVEKEKFVADRKQYESILNSQPNKIFICEDSDKKTIVLWEKWLSLFGVSDVKVMTSKGSTQNLVENGVRHQKTLNSGYSPYIFRQIDRDGLTDEQIALIEKKVFQNEKSDLKYNFKFLPVNELENFAVLVNKESFGEDFWKTREKDIIDKFCLTAEALCKKLVKEFDSDKEKESWKEFMQDGGGTASITHKMRDKALSDKNKFMPGKEMCAKLENFGPIGILSQINSQDKLPNDLKEYMLSVKSFFEKMRKE